METFRKNTTAKTHSPDGSLTISEIDRRAIRARDAQQVTTRCSIHGCDWTHEGTAADGRAAFLEHRSVDHPTADRIARNEERRRAREALAALDAGTPQRETTDLGREPMAEKAPRPLAANGGKRVHAKPPAPSPEPRAAGELGSRPGNPVGHDELGVWYERLLGEATRLEQRAAKLREIAAGIVELYEQGHAA